MAASQIKRGAVLSYAGVAFNAIAGLLYTPWMISCIGADDYGLYTLAISVINFFLLDFGLGDAVSRFMSKYYAEGRPDLANQFLGLAYKIYLIVDSVIFVALAVVFLFVDQIYAGLLPEQMETFKALYIIVAAYSVISFPFASFNGVLTANEKFVALKLCNLLRKVFTVGFIIVALLLGVGVYALVTVNAAIGVLFILIKYLIIKKSTKVRPTFGQVQEGMTTEVLGFSLWVMVAQISQRFIFSIMPSILAAVSNTWEIAVFGLASSLEGYVWSVASALNSMFLPKVSRVLVGSESEGSLQSLTERVGRVQLFIIGGIVVGFAGLGIRFVECWVGAEYETLYACALLLMIPQVISLPLLIGHTAVTAAGEVKARGMVYLAMSIVNLALGWVFSAAAGALGACLSICLAYLVRTAGMCSIYKRKLGIKLVAFFVNVFPKWLVASVVSLIVSAGFSLLLPIQGWLGFILVAVVFVVLYFLISWFYASNDYEKGLVMSALPKLHREKDSR